MVKNFEAQGLLVARATRSTPGARINYRFDTLLNAADNVMKFKYLVKRVAWVDDKSVTFVRKPILGYNGSGVHVHQSGTSRW